VSNERRYHETKRRHKLWLEGKPGQSRGRQREDNRDIYRISEKRHVSKGSLDNGTPLMS
jgi:hypothetical protein